MVTRTGTEKPQCSASVSGEGPWGAFHQHRCHKTAVVFRADKWYCKIHDPEYIEAKQKASMERFTAKWNAESDLRVKSNLLMAIFQGISIEAIRAKSEQIKALFKE